MPLVHRTPDFFRRQWRQRLSWTRTARSKKIFEALTGEQTIQMDRTVPGIRYPYPRFSRDENEGVWTCHGSFIANRYGSTAFFKDDYLFRIVVFVERNHRSGV